MTSSPRYAIYYVAAEGSALDRFGSHLLGYDAWTGKDIAFAEGAADAVSDWPELTEDARRYGFHATLKAPFHLADDHSEDKLRQTCAAFAVTPRALPQIRPVVDPISGFIAIIPGDPSPELQQLAADCVRSFEPFRAPLTADDRARLEAERRASILAMLRERFAVLGLERLAIDRIALFKQDDASSRFRIVESWPLVE